MLIDLKAGTLRLRHRNTCRNVSCFPYRFLIEVERGLGDRKSTGIHKTDHLSLVQIDYCRQALDRSSPKVLGST